MTPVDAMVQIAERAQSELPVWFSAPDVLPYASAALDLIRANPTLQPEFETALVSRIGRTPSEFLEVCMHALRWQNIKTELESGCSAAVARNDWRAEPGYRHILEAFDDDWEDAADFYASFFSPHGSA